MLSSCFGRPHQTLPDAGLNPGTLAPLQSSRPFIFSHFAQHILSHVIILLQVPFLCWNFFKRTAVPHIISLQRYYKDIPSST